METRTSQEKAAAFRRMHDRVRILVLPNAWDSASARVFEAAGFSAIATTSAGIAYALGYPDGESIGRHEMAAMLGRIVAAVAVPVTADMEAGYGPKPSDVEATARAVIAAGAVGMNLEDSVPHRPATLFDLQAQVERVQAVRQAARSCDVELVLNARVDVYLAGVGDPAGRFAQAVRRANAYHAAGADCLFVPGVRDAATIGELARSLAGPLNVLAGAGTPPIAELQRLGVARVSMGSGPMRAALTLAARIAEELRGPGTYATFTEGVMTHGEVNALMAPR